MVDNSELPKIKEGSVPISVAVPSIVTTLDNLVIILGVYCAGLGLEYVFFITHLATESQDQFAFMRRELSRASPRLATQHCQGMVTWDLLLFSFPVPGKWTHYIDDIMLTWRIASAATSLDFTGTSAGEMGGEPTENSRPGHYYKVLKFFGWVRCMSQKLWLIMYKLIQPLRMWKMRSPCRHLGVLEDFYFPLGTVLLSHTPGRKRAYVGLQIRATSCLYAKILVKQNKLWESPKWVTVWVRCVCDYRSRRQKDTKEIVPIGFWFQLQEEIETWWYALIEQQPLAPGTVLFQGKPLTWQPVGWTWSSIAGANS